LFIPSSEIRSRESVGPKSDIRHPKSDIRLKIAFYCPNKPLSHAHPSGDLTIARNLQNALNGMGHDCREIVQFRSRWFWQSGAGWLKAFERLIDADRHTRRFDPDLWLTYHSYYKSPDLIGPVLSRLHKIPYVMFQPMYSTRRRKTGQTRVGFYLNRLALKAAMEVFTNNLNDLEALGRLLPPGRITYLPPGINPEAFQRDDATRDRIRRQYGISGEARVIMTAARFRPGVKVESLVYLFRSLARLRVRGLPFTLLIVGDGPMETPVRDLAEALLPGQTIFTGRVEPRDMVHYYLAADLFAFPGIGESLGMVYLEAQACGLPVVALDSPGVAQVVANGQSGLLVLRDAGQAMAEAIGELLDDPERRSEFGGKGSRYVREQRNAQRNYHQLSDKLKEMAQRFRLAHRLCLSRPMNPNK
jgi:glycosyltransferase involved in cell wall biosynthesis